MYKVKITLPGTVTNLGLNSLGLAIGMYTTVEISRRTDELLVVETEGEGAGRYGIGLRHPVALAMMRVFQRQERSVLGISVKITNAIPINSGLGAEAAFWVAGVIGANNLLGTVYTRPQVLEIAAQVSGMPNQTVSSILGGLTTSLMNGDSLVHRALKTAGYTIVVALPELDRYASAVAKGRPERVTLSDAVYNLSRTPLLIEALRDGDLKLLAQTLDDRLHIPYLKPHVPGYDHVAEMARRAGAVAVSLSGDGPALIAFANSNHKKIAAAMEVAFENSGVKARSWIVPIDTQGVVVSVVGVA